MSATQIYYLLQWPKNAPPIACDILDDHTLQLSHWLKEISWIVQNKPSGSERVCMPPGLSESILHTALLAPHLFQVFARSSKTLAICDCEAALRAYFAYASELQVKSTRPDHVLGGVIEIDFDSVHCHRIDVESSVLCRPPMQLSALERTLVLEKLHAAMALIDQVSSAAGAMIRSVTRVLRVRCAEADATAAETDPRDIGEVRLLNIHFSRIRIIDLADSLVHESLHNFLAMYENRYGSFVTFEQTAQMRPVSPWTGNPIPYNAFTHAVFIYYSLFHFYRLIYSNSQDAQLRNEASELIAKCARGFRVAELDQCLMLIGKSPNWVFSLYRKMSEDVRCIYATNHAMPIM